MYIQNNQKLDLNTAKYCNKHLYTDIQPYEILKIISEKTIVVRKMQAEKKENSQQYDQQWLITSSHDGEVLRLHKRKDGNFYNGTLKFILNNEPIKIYDWGF